MAEFDYGNARIRVMKSRLLSRRDLEGLLEVGSLRALIAELARTAYRKTVEAALARVTGMDVITQSLHTDLILTLGKLPRFYTGDAREMVALVLLHYDIQNLKTILRGLSKNVPSHEILASLLPIGELDLKDLTDLARSPGPRGAIDLMATLRLPYAQPLMRLRAERPGIDIMEMELALDQWHYQEAWKFIQENPEETDLLATTLQMDADLANLLTILRFAHHPTEHNLLRERFGSDDLTKLFLKPGKIPFVELIKAGSQDTVESAVRSLERTTYFPALQSGLEAYARSGRLSEFEKQLRHSRMVWMSRLISKDPLGIGVVLGYLALKLTEVNNIRWIAQGINLGLRPATIRAELEFAA
jgi:V/A-type H+-transporting ATPase subunit C